MEKLKLQQVEPHPDLPGYDAWYSFSVRRDGHELSADEFTLRTDLACRIQGNEVTVPLAVKEQNAGVQVTAEDKATGETDTLYVAFTEWEPTFSDDFQGEELDLSKWGIHNEYPKSRHTVKDGEITLYVDRLEKKPGEAPNPGPYGPFVNETIEFTISGISTQSTFTQKYGCFMARLKGNPKGGCNTAFWLMPDGVYTKDGFYEDTEYKGYRCSEIDIVEYSPFFKNRYPISQHFWDPKTGDHVGKPIWVDTDSNIADDFHDYACVWDKDAVYFYFDGKFRAVNREVADFPEAIKAYIIVSTNSCGFDTEGWIGPCSKEMFPMETKAEWVKVFQKKGY